MARGQPQLHEILTELVGEGVKVYFQPPDDITMTYPCIRYERDSAETQFAGNRPYRYTKRYMVTVIDRDPLSEIPDKIAALPMTTFDRWYAADNLNHDVFNLYF
jgi:hypothetical protein